MDTARMIFQLMRSMPLWDRFDLSSARVPGTSTRPDQLVRDAQSDTAHDQVVDLLARSAAHIPGAVHRPGTPCSGSVELGTGSARLISNC